MSRIRYKGQIYDCREGETILDALLRQGANPLFSCRNGSCHVCIQKCAAGTPTDASQRSLRSSLKRAGYFLICKCTPVDDVEIAPVRPADLFSPAVISDKQLLSSDVCRIQLEPATSLYYHPGQFINLRRSDGLMRSYSLASVPAEDPAIELHIKRIPRGVMSNWIFDELSVGDEIEFQGPLGSCHYLSGAREQNMLLIGNGTGAAPLAGIVRDALHGRHSGEIRLFHGSHTCEGLYLHDLFLDLARQHSNFRYFPCVSGDVIPAGFLPGRAHKLAFARFPDLRRWRVYVAGLPQMVAEAQTMALRAGAAPSEIHADPYDTRSSQEHTAWSATSAHRLPEEGSHPPQIAGEEPDVECVDPEMWEALGQGKLLNEILTDFYTRVFEDPILSPYFRGVTRDRLIGQVFSFMRDSFAGQKLYFGARPRKAHHWMVISDEIFDYRERLMEKCLRRHGLPEHLIGRWRAFEERFRAAIVKGEPWKLVLNGVEMPLDGFGEQEILIGTLCDSCQGEIKPGERVRYHLRLGLTYCSSCAFAGATNK